jgi:acyl carrier protein
VWTAEWPCKCALIETPGAGKIASRALRESGLGTGLGRLIGTGLGIFAKAGVAAIVAAAKGAAARAQLSEITAMEDLESKVIEIVSEQMGVDKSQITRETHFINDLNADSLDTVELVMEFEDEFELSIPDEEAEKIQTVGQAIDYIKEHTNK